MPTCLSVQLLEVDAKTELDEKGIYSGKAVKDKEEEAGVGRESLR